MWQCHLVKNAYTFLLENPLFTLEIAYLLNYFCEYIASKYQIFVTPPCFLEGCNKFFNEMHYILIQNVTINQRFSHIFLLFRFFSLDLLN